MRSIVFSISNTKQHNDNRVSVKRRFFSKRFFSLYAIQSVFFLIFVIGIFLGAFSIKNADTDFFDSLDFLFITNLSARLELSAFSLFCSSLASNFIFVFTAFLLAYSAWGIFALPLLCAFKGYGVGISSAYLFSQHSITGIGFYILVVLPGTVLFLFAFIMALKESLTASFELFRLYVSPKSNFLSQGSIRTFLFRNSVILVFVALSSVLDMILWVLFANMFNF